MMRVIVTAGASGIGRAMAETFLSEGAQVAICDVDETALADFTAAYPDAIAVKASVAEPQQGDACFDRDGIGIRGRKISQCRFVHVTDGDLCAFG